MMYPSPFGPDLEMQRCMADYPMNNHQYLHHSAFRGGEWSMVPLTPDDALDYVSTPAWDRNTGKQYGYNRPDIRDDRVGTDRLNVMLGCY